MKQSLLSKSKSPEIETLPNASVVVNLPPEIKSNVTPSATMLGKIRAIEITPGHKIAAVTAVVAGGLTLSTALVSNADTRIMLSYACLGSIMCGLLAYIKNKMSGCTENYIPTQYSTNTERSRTNSVSGDPGQGNAIQLNSFFKP